MPLYRVVAIERFLVETTYHVEADSPEEAEIIVRSGKEGYDDHEMVDDDGEYLETLEIVVVKD